MLLVACQIETSIHPLSNQTNWFPMHYPSRKKRRFNRRAVECVEVAVTLPLLMLVTFAVAQITHRWHVESMLKLATYEAVKAGAMKKGGADDVTRVFREYSNALGIQNASIVFSGSQFNDDTAGRLLRARGVAQAAPNRLDLPIYLDFGSEMATGWVYARKEEL